MTLPMLHAVAVDGHRNFVQQETSPVSMQSIGLPKQDLLVKDQLCGKIPERRSNTYQEGEEIFKSSNS